MGLKTYQKITIAGVVLIFGAIWVFRTNLIPNMISMEVEMAPSTQEDFYRVYYDLGSGFNERDSVIVGIQPGEKRTTIHFPDFPALQIKSWRIDPGMKEGSVWIASITLKHELKELNIRIPLYKWTGEQLISDFIPLHHIRHFALKERGLLLISTGDDPFFIYRGHWQTVLDSATTRASHVRWFLFSCCLFFAAAIYVMLSFQHVVRLIATFVQSHERVFIDLFIASVMLWSYLAVTSHFLQEGINAVFVSAAWEWTLTFMTVLLLMMLIFFFGLKRKPLRDLKPLGKFKAQEMILLLLPMTPVVQYLLLNKNVLNGEDTIIIVAFFAALAFLSSLIMPWLFSIAGNRTVLISAGLSLTFVILNMSALASHFRWHLSGTFPIQSGIFLVISVFLIFLLSHDRRKAYWVVAFFFLLNTAMTFVKTQNEQTENAGAEETFPRIYSQVKGKKIQSYPDIFLLVYESYSDQETMLHYGFDNSAQISFLKERNFTIYPGIYSTGSMSLHSMARVLHVTNQIQEAVLARHTAGTNAVCDILKSVGYKTIGIFATDYFLQGFNPSYDECYPPSLKLSSILIKAILEGEFRYDIGFDQVAYPVYLLKKRKAFTQKGEKPIFLYTHNLLPGHSQESGQCLPDDTGKHLEGIKKANDEMREDLSLLMKSRPNALVIVAGDHGPFLTKNCFRLNDYDINEIDRYDIQDRYGAFLAIKWPEGGYGDRYDIRILQDIFPSVFAFLFKDDAIFEASRVERETLYGVPLHRMRVEYGVIQVDNQIRIEDGIIRGGKDHGRPLFERLGQDKDRECSSKKEGK